MVSESICKEPFVVFTNTTSFGLFSECFQDTVLTWPPFVYIVVCFICYFLNPKDRSNIGNTFLNLSKTILAMLMVIVCLVDLCVRAFETHHSIRPFIHLSSPCLLLLSLLLAILFIQREKFIGKTVSGVLFLYWFLITVTSALTLIPRVHALISYDTSYNRHLVIQTSILFALSFIQLVLSGAFVDGKKSYENPELNACFISRLTYWWLNSLLIKGYKKGIKADDLWSIDESMKAKEANKNFERQWLSMAKKHFDKNLKQEMSESSVPMRGSETMVLKEKKDVSHTQIDISYRPATQGPPKKVSRPSLWIAMFKFLWRQMLFCAFLKLCHDLCMFLNPKLLEYILKFIATPDVPSWHGYVYALLIFIVSFLESLAINQYFQRTFNVGVNARTALTSTIYKKALKLNNETRKKFTQGEIVNLMSTDAQKFLDLSGYIHMFWSAPLQIIISIALLYQILGPSIFAGILVMVLLIPLNAFVAKKMRSFNALQMKFKDSRIKLMAEILNGIKVLKLYAWETSFEQKILEKRQDELDVFKKMSIYAAGSSFLWTCSPLLVSLATFATYILASEENVLDPQKAFVSLSLFNILRFPMAMLPQLIGSLIQAFVSVKRIEVFLMGEELELAYTENKLPAENMAVTFDDASFEWEAIPTRGPILQDLTLSIPKGALVGVVGQVGCGKSTLLSAILGETEKVKGSCLVNGSVAYVAQQAWIQNATIESNILFGGDKDHNKYNKVVEACALMPDFKLLPARDLTEVGEQGITLSGGQKQRLTLARAVYADKDLYLLDDTLSAVDAHVGKHIFENVIGKQGLLKDKTRIFVTHGLKFLREFDMIVVLSAGKISEVGTYDQLLANNSHFAEFLREYLEEESQQSGVEMNEEDIMLREEILQHLIEDKGAIRQRISRLRKDTNRSDNSINSLQQLSNGQYKRLESHLSTEPRVEPNEETTGNEEKGLLVRDAVKGKQMDEEKMETGNIKLSVYKSYLGSIGIAIVLLVSLLQFSQAVFSVGSNFWLSDWSNQNVVIKKSSDNIITSNITSVLSHGSYSSTMRLTVYGLLGLGQSLSVLVGAFVFVRGAIKATDHLHRQVLHSIFRCPMSFFEATPVGRLLNVFSKDVDSVDQTLPMCVDVWCKCFMAVIGMIFVISFNIPVFLLVILPLGVLYYIVQRFYIRTSRQLKRIESVSRSPVFSHFSETIQGVATIRAFKQINRFIEESESRIDKNTASYNPTVSANRWLAIRLELIGNCLVLAAALFSIIFRLTISPGIVGLCITYALSITQTLNWLVRMTSDVEANIVSVERMKDYMDRPAEAEWVIADKKPPNDWPAQGAVSFNEYSLAYKNAEAVLKSITCFFKAGERIGLVGRTGAGKSSMTLALFRILEPLTGSIIIDDIDITSIGLHDLRSRLTIIPQDPVLFSGSLRMNLDPFNKYSDAQVWDSLKYVQLDTYVKELPEKLEYTVGEGGVNFSLGQRQLFCLARALLRKSKILVLDEATAAVDAETDQLIQTTIRDQFKDCTTLTIAHRINTIMDYSRILVMDHGMIKEFDTPQALLALPDGIFKSLANEAGISA